MESVEDENWVTSEHFKDILEQKEKEISEEGMKRLEDENAELRKRLEFADRRSSSVSLLGKSKFQELERDVTKLQAKICKVGEFAYHTVKIFSYLYIDGTVIRGPKLDQEVGNIPRDLQVTTSEH